MLRTLVRFTLLGTAVAGLMACASGPYEPRQPESAALQVMKAACYTGLRDTAQPPQNENAAPDGLGKAIAWGIGNALAVPPGFSPGSAGALGLVSGIFGAKDPDEKAWISQIVAWMPQSEAPTAAAARERLNQALWGALSRALDEVTFPDGYSIEKRTWENYEHLTERFASLRGGECGEKHVFCQMKLMVHTLPRQAAAPRIAGGFGAYAFAGPFNSSYIDRRSFRGKVKAVFPDLAVYQRASAALPPWVFIYLAPEKVAYDDSEAGRVLLPYPVVLNQGKILYFLKPSP